MIRKAVLFAVALLVAPALWAQGIVDPVVTGDTLTAGIALPGGIGADLTVAFENVVGLTPDAVGLSVRLTSLTDLLGLLGLSLSLPGAFPVLLAIEPPASGGLSFSGTVSVSLHTHNLPFVANSPLRLFKSSGGLKFEDVTEETGMGSYRVRGTSGGFSLFLILVDLRPIDTVITKKFDQLAALLDQHEAQIAPAVLTQLDDQLAAARDAYRRRSYVTAIQRTEAFAAYVAAHSGAEIPNVWRSTGDLTNVAGALRAAAGTLRFSLTLKSNSGGGILGL